LGYFTEAGRHNFIEHYSYRHLDNIAKDNKYQVVQHRIPEQKTKLPRYKQEPEVLQTDKLGSENPVGVVELGKRYVDPWHWHIAEHEEKDYGGQAHNHQGSVFYKVVPETVQCIHMATLPVITKR